MKLKYFLLTFLFSALSIASYAQCPQFTVTSSISVSWTGSDGVGSPETVTFAGIACGGTNPVFSACYAPPTYNAVGYGTSTISNFQITSQTHNVSDPLATSYPINLSAWENDCGNDDSYDCGVFLCGSDDSYVELNGVSINMPTRLANGCFASTSVTQVVTATAALNDPNNENCDATDGTWTFTITTTINYSTPAPTGNDVSIFQCGAIPVLSVNTCTGAMYQWQGGAGGGTVSGAQNQFYTPSASEVNTAVPGTYNITVQMIHPCTGALSTSKTIKVVVTKECPEIDQVTATPNPKACEGDVVNLGLTIKSPICAAGSFVEGTDYLVQWYLDGNIIKDGAGPDGKFNTADDITNLSSTTYTMPSNAAACGTQDRVFEARIVCKQPNAPSISQGTLNAYCSSTLKQQYDGAGSSTSNGYPASGSTCFGANGSEGPSAGTLPMSNYFNACTGQFNTSAFGGTPAEFQLNLTALPACAEVTSVEYQFQGTTSSTCNAVYSSSWASETNLVFYSPDATPSTSNAWGSFNWSNAGFTQCGTPDCNQSGGNYNFVNTVTFPQGYSAQGVWQILIFDDYNDGGSDPDGEVNYAYMKVNYIIPPGCSPNSIKQANAITTFDKPTAATVTPSSICGEAPTITGCNVTYDADGSGSYALTSNPNTAPGSTIYIQNGVADAPTGCYTRSTTTVPNIMPITVPPPVSGSCATIFDAAAAVCPDILTTIPDGTSNFTTASNLPITIGAASGVGGSSTITVTPPGTNCTITNVTVSTTGLSHTWCSDVQMFITAPGGSEQTILNGTTGSGADFVNGNSYVFGSGTGFNALPGSGTNVAAGNYVSTNVNMSTFFDGAWPTGNWIIRFNDDTGGDGGSISNLSLNISYTGCQVSGPGMVEWYTTPSGGVPDATGDTYDLVTDGGYSSPLPAGDYTMYAQCAGSTCRTAVTINSNGSACTFPVELASFTGREEGKKNLLQWTTSAEINASHFELETSTNYNSGFKSIGTIAATGGPSVETNYSFLDTNPTSTAYYRLKMVDNDGSFEYSNIVKLQRKVKGISVLQLVPNPTNNTTAIDFAVENDGVYTVSILDISGKELYSTSESCYKNNVTHVDLNLSNYANGIYMIQIKGSESIVNKKLIKQ